MRMRWMAGLVGASAVILATAVSLAQKPEKSRGIAARGDSADSKRWRASNDGPVVKDGSPLPRDVPPAGPFDGPVAFPETPDPMTAVDEFLRRNRKEADESIQALGREAEALRARLAKVEAALARWQAVAGALQVESDGPSALITPAGSPAQLDPVEPQPGPGEPTSSLPASPPPSPAGPPAPAGDVPAPDATPELPADRPRVPASPFEPPK